MTETPAMADLCVDCGAALLLCDHVITRITDPMLAFQGKVIGELQAALAAERDEWLSVAADLTGRLHDERVALTALTAALWIALDALESRDEVTALDVLRRATKTGDGE